MTCMVQLGQGKLTGVKLGGSPADKGDMRGDFSGSGSENPHRT